MRQLVLLYGLFFCTQVAQSSVWEYGEDYKHLQNIGHSAGHMTVRQKHKQLPFTVPDCMKILYVRVEIDNDVTVPEINYNEHMHIITIHYRPAEKSICTYRAYIKGITKKKCNKGDSKKSKKSKKPKKKSKKNKKSKNNKTPKESDKPRESEKPKEFEKPKEPEKPQESEKPKEYEKSEEAIKSEEAKKSEEKDDVIVDTTTRKRRRLRITTAP